MATRKVKSGIRGQIKEITISRTYLKLFILRK